MADFIEGFVRVRNGMHSIWYKIIRPSCLMKGNVFPMLVTHGGPGMPHSYLNNLSCGDMNNRSVIFYDQLGCGKSDKPVLNDFVNEAEFKDFYSVLRSANDLQELIIRVYDLYCKPAAIDKLVDSDTLLNDGVNDSKNSLFNLHLCGHSFGGIINYEYICNYYHIDYHKHHIRVISNIMISTPTATNTALYHMNRQKAAIIMDSIQTKQCAMDTVIIDPCHMDFDRYVQERYMKAYMLRRIPVDLSIIEESVCSPGPSNCSSGTGTCSGSSERSTTSTTSSMSSSTSNRTATPANPFPISTFMESLVDPTVGSWCGMDNPGLRKWRIHTIDSTKCAVEANLPSTSPEDQQKQCGSPPLPTFICTGLYDCINTACIEQWKLVDYDYISRPLRMKELEQGLNQPPLIGSNTRNSVPMIDYAVIPDASHMSMLENPTALIDVLMEYMRKQESG